MLLLPPSTDPSSLSRRTPALLLLLLSSLARETSAYSLLGCFTPQESRVSLGLPILTSNSSSSTALPPSVPRGPVSVQACEDRCSAAISPSDRNSTVFLMQLTQCFCYKFNSTQMAQDSAWSQVNPVECSQLCPSDNLPCGETVHARFSMYTVGLGSSIVFPAIDATSNSTKKTNTGPQVTSADIGTGNGQDVYKIVLISGIVLGCLAFLALLGVLTYFIRKSKSLKKLPQPPAAAAGGSTTDSEKLKVPLTTTAAAASSVELPHSTDPHRSSFLIPNVLPVTPNQIYSVITPYLPYKRDEIKLKADHVVCLRQVFEDQWALGSNVTTGETGVFPLTCLVPDEEWLKAGIVVPPRTASLSNSILTDLEKTDGSVLVPLAPPPTTTTKTPPLAHTQPPLSSL